MATKEYIGRSTAVAQVDSIEAGGTISGETFTISVGGVVIASHTDTTGAANDARDALVTAWNNSTHPYATGVTAASSGAGTLTLTADTAGVPFTVALNTPGGSATFTRTAVTASSGPNHADDAANWSGGTLPANSDDILLRNTDVSLLWGLSGLSSVTLGTMIVEQSFTGKIGLPHDKFTTSAGVEVETADEYRDTYLTFSTMARLAIGPSTNSQQTGSTFIKIDCGNGATDIRCVRTSAVLGNKMPVNVLVDHSSAKLIAVGGGIGVGNSEPGDSGELSSIELRGSGSNVRIGESITLATLDVPYGVCIARNTPTTVRQAGTGEVQMIGSGTITNGEGNVSTIGGSYTITNAT